MSQNFGQVGFGANESRYKFCLEKHGGGFTTEVLIELGGSLGGQSRAFRCKRISMYKNAQAGIRKMPSRGT